MRPLALLVGVVLLLGAIVGTFLVRSGSRQLPDTAPELAAKGVSRNADWAPIVLRLDGLDMTLVPAGCFIMGSTDLQLVSAINSCERFFGSGKCQVDFRKSETPPHEVCFNHPFWIGQNEVTNRLFGSSSSTEMYREPSWPRDTVTWYEASRFCLSHHARLPTEAEWEFAARGPDGRLFPWGDRFDLALVVSGRLSPENAGSIQAGASWVGALDMSGGVQEWVADWYGPYPASDETDPVDPQNGQQRVLRGGSWFSFAAFLLRTAHREPASPDASNSTIGFRCARDFQ
jgi:iron(II)-dependent oxidoreductase